jgi:hypothetical protein
MKRERGGGERERDLGNEDDSKGLIKGSAVHVHSRTERQHKLAHLCRV